MARDLAGALDLPCIHIDSLYHGDDPVQRREFASSTREALAGDQWVCEYQRPVTRRLARRRADLVVWLLLPRQLVLARLVRRRLDQRLGHALLPNEDWQHIRRPLRQTLTDPERIRFYVSQTHTLNARSAAEMSDMRSGVPVVILRSRREVARWLSGPVAAIARRNE